MRKLFYISCIFPFLIACQGGKTANNITDETTAGNILLNYLKINEENKDLLSSFHNCKLVFSQSKPNKKDAKTIESYTCSIPLENGLTGILVISEAPELKNEVNPAKKRNKELVYIASLTYDTENKQLTGTKVLFNPGTGSITDHEKVSERR